MTEETKPADPAVVTQVMVFDANDLDILAATLETEMTFLRYNEHRGLDTARQQAAVAQLRAKVIRELNALKK